MSRPPLLTWLLPLALAATLPATAQLAIRGDRVHTMTGRSIDDGIVLVRDGKIERVGASADTPVPDGYRTLEAAVVTPGLIDARTVAGLSGYLNQRHDQDQLDTADPLQPHLRAIDAYDPREPLVEYLRDYGITTIHTGHGPGALISGQTMIVKTVGATPEEALLVPSAMVAASLGEQGRAASGKSPGTRGRMIAMLRTELVKSLEYRRKQAKSKGPGDPARDLKLEALAEVAAGEKPLLVSVHRAHDIVTAIRLGKEFNLKLVLDGATEAYLVLREIRESGYPVLVHPTMARAVGERENLTFENAFRLQVEGIPFALQSGFEPYVPKTRVVLFEAGLAAAHGLTFHQALESVTIGAARLLGIDQRVGSLAPGKDADIALYDGDPFEYTSHCIGVIVNGVPVSESPQ